MFATFTKIKVLAAAAVAATGLVAGAQQASAHDHFSFGISFGTPVYTAPACPASVYAPAPVYQAPACTPAPVVVAPAPTVVYAPPPVVYYRPAPVYYRGGWSYDHHGWDRHEEHHDWDRRDDHHEWHR